MAFAIGVISVVILSLLPSKSLPSLGVSDKLEHFVAYAILGVIAGLAYPTLRAATLLMAFLSALGITLELCQWFVPGRSPETFDAIASGLGAILALCAHLLFHSRSADRTPNESIKSATPSSASNPQTSNRTHSRQADHL
jgi:VanZ family protein